MNLSKKEAVHLTDGYGDCIERVASINRSRDRQPLAFVRTFGCQMNAHDSEKLEETLLRMGYGKAPSEDCADLALINTCCVRENAENRVFGNLGKLKELKGKKPDMLVAVCGCMMQEDAAVERIKKSYRHVDVVFGTFNLDRFPELLLSRMESGRQIIDIWKGPREDRGIPSGSLATARHFAHKASLSVMFGCDNHCSYCIVPYVRGAERSRPPEGIMEEARALADSGAKEVMLLGQNVNSYGKGLNLSFAELLERVCEIGGIERIRFMTSHPKDLGDDLIQVMKAQPKIARHLHLPVQSGSSRILSLMNRRYTKESYLNLVEKIKSSMPDIALTTDFIVGFPGETEEDFADTLDLAERCRFQGAFTFLYSKRTGTPAAKMPNQVDPEVAGERFKRLLACVNGIQEEANARTVGKVLKVLVEEPNAKNPELMTGRGHGNELVHFKADKSLAGQFVDVRITESKIFYLMGEALT
ncbi:MAG: tRNA (N6-isopentenyl adenosine(37)-C2)-methylthiotransferase MiaB [Clostridiales bacterium]|jgi:tRNA-2-methylthio-N6-dimethylallyladenosine synthase|nr:tRNA (N6-isopentenyl adenosine(37)-C2)-methylthiotransferase MiaB [Clostridiales bacterium]